MATVQPEPLSEGYQKARRNVTLLSGLLIAWEYVGIGLGEQGATRTADLPGNLQIEIRNAEAVPVVIFVLVLYFVLRLWIEWWQCDPLRTVQRAARFDYLISLALAGLAVAIFVLQQVIQIQLADYVAGLELAAMLVAFVGSMTLSSLIRRIVLFTRLRSRITPRLHRRIFLAGAWLNCLLCIVVWLYWIRFELSRAFVEVSQITDLASARAFGQTHSFFIAYVVMASLNAWMVTFLALLARTRIGLRFLWGIRRKLFAKRRVWRRNGPAQLPLEGRS